MAAKRDDDLDPAIPGRLRDDLAALFRARIDVPRRVDDDVLEAARARLGGAREGSRRLRIVRWAGLAAAAVLLVALWIRHPVGLRDAREPQDVAAVRREDVDGNGRVDILDAFLLARRIEAGDLRGDWDLNGDGRVDEGDSDLVAREAVRVR